MNSGFEALTAAHWPSPSGPLVHLELPYLDHLGLHPKRSAKAIATGFTACHITCQIIILNIIKGSAVLVLVSFFNSGSCRLSFAQPLSHFDNYLVLLLLRCLIFLVFYR